MVNGCILVCFFFFFKQKTAYEITVRDWSSDVCSSDLESSWQLPWIHSLFGNAPAVASGIAAALKAKGRTDVRVVGQGGDGGTVDIGFACLSGMFERNDDVLYVCYDNEGYMNTGVQRSGATPAGASTANTRPVGSGIGNAFGTG